MDPILQKPLKEMTSLEELTELFHALPEKHVERLYIIEKIEELEKNAAGEEKKKISQSLDSLQPRKQKDMIMSALHIPWGDWSRIYRVRGLFRAIEFIESLLDDANITPNTVYNLSFLYYYAYNTVRDENGKKTIQYREKALTLAKEARDIYYNEHVGRLEHFMTRMGSLIIHEWRKNLPEYCMALACNIISLINLIDHKYEDALLSINESFEPHPTPPESYFSMGIYFLRMGAFNPAIRMLNESIKKRGEHSAEAYYQLGRVYYLKVQYFLEQLESLRKNQESIKRQKQLQKLIDKRIEKAINAFEASLSEDQYFSLPYYWMGLTQLLKRECSCETAVELIDFAIQLDPKTISRYLNHFTFSCHSVNTTCNQEKLTAMVENLTLEPR
ncbi:tetratricopeptide repeat protein [Thermodesulfobacteriota bacterium]